jgi:hypothetical protein
VLLLNEGVARLPAKGDSKSIISVSEMDTLDIFPSHNSLLMMANDFNNG